MDRPQTIHPTLTYRDAAAAIDWLVRAFGFIVEEVHHGADGAVVHAELSFGASRVMVGSVKPDGWGFFAPPPGSSANYVVIDDADAHHARAAAAGAEVVMPLADQSYGSRDYSVRDPEGNLWSFGTYRPGGRV